MYSIRLDNPETTSVSPLDRPSKRIDGTSSYSKPTRSPRRRRAPESDNCVAIDESEKLRIARSEVSRAWARGVLKGVTWDDLLSTAYLEIAQVETKDPALLRTAIRGGIVNYLESEYTRHVRLNPCAIDAASKLANADLRTSELDYDVLTTRERTAIHLRYWYALSNEDIADVMGISLRRVEQLLESSHRKLAGTLNKKIFVMPIRFSQTSADSTDEGERPPRLTAGVDSNPTDSTGADPAAK